MTSTASFNRSGLVSGNINLGSLITTFTPPATCLSHLYLEGSDAPVLSATFQDLVPTGTFPTLGWPTQTECYPPGYQAASSAFRASEEATAATFGGYFSPGVCPAGYTSACTKDIRFTSAGDQIALCCPYGYQCWVSIGSCVSEFTTDNMVTFVSASSGTVTEMRLPRSFLRPSGSTFTSYINSALAAQIQVRWAASDPAGNTFSPTMPPVPGITVSPTALPVPSPMPAIGPAIYMSVGIPGALIILACVFFFIRVSRKRKNAAGELSRLDTSIAEKAELTGECVLPQESGGIMRVELDAIEPVRVVGGPGRTFELETPIAELAAPFPELEGEASSVAPEVAEQLSTEATSPLTAMTIADEAGVVKRVSV
ncbi:hypothetical protein Q9L58_001885 [Maublancomyces gigas]|uniref:Uncharacterized protein n=1 Tax=Discina gigas TaxID=1032678 RepID=A0ABR3GSU1_9PEZI